jgi:hypothetical protein
VTVSDFGISGPAAPGDDGQPRDDDPRYKLSELVRRVISLVVAAPIDDAALDSASAKLGEVVAALEGSAGSGRRSRVHPDASGPAQDFFPTSPVIGLANPIAPPVEVESVAGGLNGRVFFDNQYEGPPGCVHGGNPRRSGPICAWSRATRAVTDARSGLPEPCTTATS